MGIHYKSFLRKVPLFADLPDPELERVCRQVDDLRLAPGELLFQEGSSGDHAYVIVEGQIEIYKTVNDKKVQLAIRQPGEVIGETSLIDSSPRNASGVALSDTLLISIGHGLIDDLLRTSPGAARTMLHTVIMRLQSTEASLLQSEKMAQLGTFTAGIAHEINNPSAAVLRGSDQLKKGLEQYETASIKLHSQLTSPDQIEHLASIRQQIQNQAKVRPAINAITRMDMEEAVENWLSEKNITDPWELAPHLVDLGFDPATLDSDLSSFSGETLSTLISWITVEAKTQRLLDEIHQGARRISDIVHALKTYIYLDQAPGQEIDIHEGLENTLIILRHKLKQGIKLEREYDPTLPRIFAHGSELNQVWTNLIDNAIDVLQDAGQITLRTKRDDRWVFVEVEDNGPGIPPAVQSRLFYPFFTTKPVGKGTGLGLSISLQIVKKHGGDIQVFSQPGQTRFSVRLPVGHPPAE